MAGAMALSIYTTGVLTKMYSEVLENEGKNIQDSITTTGATNLQSYRHGLLPHTFPTFIRLALYRLESNIRNSTILGVIGAGGIGTTLVMNITWRNWGKVGFLLLGISIMIIIIDKLSQMASNYYRWCNNRYRSLPYNYCNRIFGSLVLKDIKLDFGVIDPNDRINALIGLDFLIRSKSANNSLLGITPRVKGMTSKNIKVRWN